MSSFVVVLEVRSGTDADGRALTREVRETVHVKGDDDALKAARIAAKRYAASVLEVRSAHEQTELELDAIARDVVADATAEPLEPEWAGLARELVLGGASIAQAAASLGRDPGELEALELGEPAPDAGDTAEAPAAA